MATLAELRAKWEARRAEHACLGSMAPVAAVAAEVLADLKALADSSQETVTITEAHAIGGYSVDHLRRLVADGTIENVGRRHRPQVRRSDVPRKPGYLPLDAGEGHFSNRRRIVASSLTEGTS